MMTIDEIKRKIAPVCRKYDIDSAYVFGSYARGEADEKSDVDIRIEDGGKIKTLFTLSGFRIDLMEALGVNVDVITKIPKDGDFQRELERDEVAVYVA